LCPNGGAINHIDVAEDVNGTPDQKMGFIDSRLGFQSLTEFGPAPSVVDTSTASKGCGQCHGKTGTVSSGTNTINLYQDLPPDRGILFTNDPNEGAPVSQVHLSEICTRLASTSQLSSNDKRLAMDLCSALSLKTP